MKIHHDSTRMTSFSGVCVQLVWTLCGVTYNKLRTNMLTNLVRIDSVVQKNAPDLVFFIHKMQNIGENKKYY